MTKHTEYPKAKYHATHEPTVVQNEVEDAQLGDEWKNSPADFGIITAPSVAQMKEAKFGLPKLAAKVEETTEEEQEEAPTPRRRGR